MKYPALIANKTKLLNNIQIIQGLCRQNDVSFCAVTKCFCAAPQLTKVYYDAGVRDFADTRLINLKKINYPDAVKWLLRAPMLSDAEESVRYADISLNSEIKTIAALSEQAIKQGKKHKVILMVDLGDLREGVMPSDAVNIAGEIIKLDGVTLYGIGANLNCFGGVIPTDKNMAVLTKTAQEITDKLGIKLSVISGGNSGSIHFLADRKMPQGINHLRIGEAILFGGETSFRTNIKGAYQDVFRLDTQIIELKKKPSVPIGEIGTNAFGETPVFEDKGLMLRAIVACGRQDVDSGKISPLDPKLEILGQSSDHMIIDVTHSDKTYAVGDIISFSISYGSLLSLSTSEYVNKVTTD